jgi:hypothetical protein
VIKIESCKFREVSGRPQGLRYYDLVGLVSLGLDPLEFYQGLHSPSLGERRRERGGNAATRPGRVFFPFVRLFVL